MDINKESLKGHIDNIILSLIRSQDLYGYEIAKKVKEITSGSFELKEATMYIALKRLEKKEYIESYWNDGEGSNGGRRRYYRILPKGEDFFREKVEEWVFTRNILDKFMEV